jgi:hypothetical protein
MGKDVTRTAAPAAGSRSPRMRLGIWGIRRIERAGPGPSTESATAAKAGGTVPPSRNARRHPNEPKYVRSWSRVWSWPIPPYTYVDPDIVREYREEEVGRERSL